MDWIDTETAANVLNITVQAVRKNANDGKYGEIRYVESKGGNSGLKIQINVDNLPLQAQLIYLKYVKGLNNTPKPWTNVDTSIYTNKERNSAHYKIYVVNEWDSYCLKQLLDGRDELKVVYTKEFLEIWNTTRRKPDEPKVSQASLYRWREYIDNEDFELLVENRGKKRKFESTIDEQDWRVFRQTYLEKNTNIAGAYKVTMGIAAAFGRKVPSKRTFERRAEREITFNEMVYFKEGKKAFDDKCMPYAERAIELIESNDWWGSDHHVFDLFCKHPDNGKPFRPWVTLWMDRRSRKVVGTKLSVQPNQDVILAALAQGIYNYGIPNNVHIDNGKDYKAKGMFDFNEQEMLSISRVLGVIPHYAIPYNAKSKPEERFFKTLTTEFENLWSSYCGNKPGNRPDRLKRILKSETQMLTEIPTMEQMEAVLNQYIYEVYNNESQGGRGMDNLSPNQVFEANLKVKRTATDEMLRMMFMKSELKTVQRNGFSMFGRWWWDEQLVPYRNEKIFVRYDITEIGRVFAFDEKGNFICELEKMELLAYGATAEDYREHMSRKRKVRERVKRAQEDLQMEELSVEQLIGARAQAAKAQVEAQEPVKPKVIEMVRNANLEEAARRMNKKPPISTEEQELAIIKQFENRKKSEDEDLEDTMNHFMNLFEQQKKQQIY